MMRSTPRVSRASREETSRTEMQAFFSLARQAHLAQISKMVALPTGGVADSNAVRGLAEGCQWCSSGGAERSRR